MHTNTPCRRKRATDFFDENNIPHSTGRWLIKNRPDELPAMIKIGRAYFLASDDAEAEWEFRKLAEARQRTAGASPSSNA